MKQITTNSNTFRLKSMLFGLLALTMLAPELVLAERFCQNIEELVSDERPVSSVIDVDLDGQIRDVDVFVYIEHQNVGDLGIFLNRLNDNGSISSATNLMRQPQKDHPDDRGCNGRNIEATFDDDANGTADELCTNGFLGLSGRVVPEDLLSRHNRQDVRGRWGIRVQDHEEGIAGYVGSWCIDFEIDIPEQQEDDGFASPLEPFQPGESIDLDALLDLDSDGVENGSDNCPFNANPDQANADNDSTGDVCDECPEDAEKVEEGECGCGRADVDVDLDGDVDCLQVADDPFAELVPEEQAEPEADPEEQDSDSDGVSDAQEAIDGTNPADRGSVREKLNTELCLEWNGFLKMGNVLELVNRSQTEVEVVVTLYGMDGTGVESEVLRIAASQQRDHLVHDMPGHQADAFGQICIAHDGEENDVDGRMMHYRPGTAGSGREFEFAIVLPFSNGRTGSQFVPFNTFQPSLNAADRSNFVANWIQVTNLSDDAESGRLTFYDMAGSVLEEVVVQLRARGRVDVSGHQFGQSRVGMVAWRPDNNAARFIVRNARYYESSQPLVQFDSAFQLEGQVGTGEELTAMLDTRDAAAIIELFNTSDEEIMVSVEVFDDTGSKRATLNIALSAFSSYHFIANPALGENKLGLATVRSTQSESLVAVSMEYGYRRDKSISYVYGTVAKEVVGSELTGSYNTYLRQTTELVLLNSSDEEQTVQVSLLRSGGVQVLENQELVVPASGVTTLTVNDYELENVYGTLSVNAATDGAIMGWMLREKAEEFVAPTQLR